MKYSLRDVSPLPFLALAVALGAHALSQNPTTSNSSSLTVKTSPGAIIWVDTLRYGAVPQNGELVVKNVAAGARTVRARLKGKREAAQTITLAADSPQSIQIALSTPADPAELSFQTAEELRDRGKSADAIKEYRRAIQLRPRYPAARLGLARSLLSSENYEAALAQARQVLSDKPGPSPEAHTIIANIKRTQGFTDDALAAYRTALTQARNFSPEAHTGMAIAYQDRNRAEDAIKHYKLAVAQANDTEPILYFLLGSALEREARNKEAVVAYEKYLELAPNSSQASAIRSVVKQLKKEIR